MLNPNMWTPELFAKNSLIIERGLPQPAQGSPNIRAMFHAMSGELAYGYAHPRGLPFASTIGRVLSGDMIDQKAMEQTMGWLETTATLAGFMVVATKHSHAMPNDRAGYIYDEFAITWGDAGDVSLLSPLARAVEAHNAALQSGADYTSGPLDGAYVRAWSFNTTVTA